MLFLSSGIVSWLQILLYWCEDNTVLSPRGAFVGLAPQTEF